MFRTMIVMGLAFGVAGAVRQAQAGVLVTPPLTTGGGDNVNCRLLSLRDVTDVTIQIRDTSGAAATSFSFNLLAGQTNSSTDLTPPAISYCVVEGAGVSKAKSRVAHCVRDASNTPIECVTAP